MTVPYSDNFMRALFKWKGSLWKGVLRQLAVWLLAYYAIRLFLVFALPPDMKLSAKATIRVFEVFTQRIPLQFLLGFYVVQTVTRWWAQVQAMPWPDDLIATINAMLFESDDETRAKRKNIARYVTLSLILGWRNISSAVMKQFPNFDSLVDSGLLQPEERDILIQCPHPDNQWDLPLNWIYEIVRRKLGNQFSFVKEMNTLRANFRTLSNYHTICVPLVYTQTATVAVYGYFSICLVGHQFLRLDGSSQDVDLYIPYLSILQFIFSVGWLNVAEDLVKPFGNDDDDVEILNILQRHARFATAATDAPDRVPLDSMAKVDQSVDIDTLFGFQTMINVRAAKTNGMKFLRFKRSTNGANNDFVIAEQRQL